MSATRLVLLLVLIAAPLLPASAKTESQRGAARQAAPFGRAAGALVPAHATAALLLDGATGAAGLRQLLTAAAGRAPSLSPEDNGATLASEVSVDLLDAGSAPAAGLASSGPRALVIDGDATGLSAPVADAASAQRALEAWIGQAGELRPTRPPPFKGPLAAGDGAHLRAGMLAPVAGGLRLLTASGRGATLLVAALAHVGARKSDTPHLALSPSIASALSAAHGPAILWLHGSGPVLGAVLSLDASKSGLVASGLALPAGKAVLLSGAAPEQDCGQALACTRVSLGPAALPLLSRVARELVDSAVPDSGRAIFEHLLERALLATTGPAALRIDSLDVQALGHAHGLPGALSFLARGAAKSVSLVPPVPTPASLAALANGAAVQGRHGLCLQSASGIISLGAPCPAAAPAPLAPGKDSDLLLDARFNTATLAGELRTLSPIDALRGQAAAGAFAAQLLWGELLANSGPITAEGRRVASSPGQIALTVRWPLAR